MISIDGAAGHELLGEIWTVAQDLPLFLTASLYRRWHLRWGATAAEVAAALPGDGLVPHPQYGSTRAITIGASPAEVWPWLVQVGCQRAGFYSNDLLDNHGRPSARDIQPQWQHLDGRPAHPDDPRGDDPGKDRISVHSFQAPEWLLWSKPGSTWAWSLTEPETGVTRLVTRIRARYDWQRPVPALAALLLMEFGDFAMLRRMLRSMRARAGS